MHPACWRAQSSSSRTSACGVFTLSAGSGSADGRVVTPSAPQSTVVQEGKAIIDSAMEGAVTVRLSGGVAITLNSPADVEPALTRAPKDVDLITDKRGGTSVDRILTSLGYDPDVQF